MDEDRRDSTAAIEASFAEAPPEPAAAVDPPAGGPAPAGAEEEEIAGELELQPDEPETPPLPVPVPPPAARAAPAPAATARESEGDEGPQTIRLGAPLQRGGGGRMRILLVDDEADVRRILAEHFARGGHEVLEAEDPDSGVKQAGRIARSDAPFLVVTDLGMPTSGGSSFQGGFELVKRMAKMNLRPPVLLMAETLSGALQARARQLGIRRVVFKPSLSKLDPPQFEADLRAFAHKLLADVLPLLDRGAAAHGSPRRGAAPGRPSASAPAAPPPPTAAPAAPPPSAATAGGRTVEELSRELETLQRRLEDLRRGGDATQVSALVMEVAREFFERAILFLVKNQQARGLGGFGRAPGEENLNLLAREVAVPLAEPSVFQDVVGRRRPHWGPLPDGKWSQYLMGRIGRFKSEGVALIPLLTHRETIAVLFGDNPETGRAPGRLESLEVFINQAGVALENAFLQRKLQALQGREVS
jgi:CheY-like chemotaxis protein